MLLVLSQLEWDIVFKQAQRTDVNSLRVTIDIHIYNIILYHIYIRKSIDAMEEADIRFRMFSLYHLILPGRYFSARAS